MRSRGPLSGSRIGPDLDRPDQRLLGWGLARRGRDLDTDDGHRRASAVSRNRLIAEAVDLRTPGVGV